MPERRGYRSDRLRRRRRSRVERSQAWFLYVLAAVVAFVAVLGAWYIAGGFRADEEPERKSGYLAAVQLTVEGEEQPVAALLVVQDPEGRAPGVYFVPPDLLLEGPNGEYVFAADAMAQGVLARDLARIVRVPVDAVFTMPVAELGEWAGSDQLQVGLERPVSVDLGGDTRVLDDGALVPVADLPAIFAAPGANRVDLALLQTALVRAVLAAAALRPGADDGQSAGASPDVPARPTLAAVRARISSGEAEVARFPSGSRVAEGQFAFVPEPEGIMAGITRRSPAYHAAVTVEVLNGSGRVGVASAVVTSLASLDVNLPAPVNAETFSYRQTQILAGPETLPVARDIRAILGRGVVLDGTDLPKGTIRVIVGDDFQPPQSSPKDQQ